MRVRGAALHRDGLSLFVPVAEWKAAIAELGVSAIIFDCDGTLVESSKAHLRSMQHAAEMQGQRMSPEWYMQRTGLDRVSLFSALSETAGLDFDPSRAARDSIAAFARHVGCVRPIPETADLIRHLSAQGYPIGIGTNAEAEVARQSLEAAGLAHCYAVLASVSDGCPPKPDAAIFIRAARGLGVEPDRVLVIEDSLQGLEAALAAGMPALVLDKGAAP